MRKLVVFCVGLVLLVAAGVAAQAVPGVQRATSRLVWDYSPAGMLNVTAFELYINERDVPEMVWIFRMGDVIDTIWLFNETQPPLPWVDFTVYEAKVRAVSGPPESFTASDWSNVVVFRMEPDGFILPPANLRVVIPY